MGVVSIILKEIFIKDKLELGITLGMIYIRGFGSGIRFRYMSMIYDGNNTRRE